MKKSPLARLLLCLPLLVLCASFGAPALANSPPPAPKRSQVTLTVYHAPQGVAYADFMLRADKYALNERLLAKHPELKGSPIVTYSIDGLASYTLHGTNEDFPTITPHQYESADQPGKMLTKLSTNFTFYLLKNTRVVLLDQNGGVLAVSPPITLPSPSDRHIEVNYDCAANTVTVEPSASKTYPWFVILGVILLRIVFSIVVEVLIAIPFRIRPLPMVAFLNFITQFVLTIGMFLCSLFHFPYINTLLIFEGVVVLMEFGGLLVLASKNSVPRTALFVVVANSVTLGVGLLLIALGIFTA